MSPDRVGREGAPQPEPEPALATATATESGLSDRSPNGAAPAPARSPRRLIVSSTLIWRRVLRARNRAPDRLRWWISLLLAMLIALAVASGLTRPTLDALGATAERVVLVLDNSATLATRTSDMRTRWEHAQSRAREIIASGGADSRACATTSGTASATIATARRGATSARNVLRSSVGSMR